MNKDIAFWLVYLLMLIFGAYPHFRVVAGTPRNYIGGIYFVCVAIMLFLLGLHNFGNPLK